MSFVSIPFWAIVIISVVLTGSITHAIDFEDCFKYSKSPAYEGNVKQFCEEWFDKYQGVDKCEQNPNIYFFRARTSNKRCHPYGLTSLPTKNPKEFDGVVGAENPQARDSDDYNFENFKECFIFRSDFYSNNHEPLDDEFYCKLWQWEWTGATYDTLNLDHCLRNHEDFLIPLPLFDKDCSLVSNREYAISPRQPVRDWVCDNVGFLCDPKYPTGLI